MTENGNPAGAAAPFRLDGCLVLPALNKIRRGEETVCVEPRVMMVLVRLAARPGEVLSRERLFDTVWSGSVVCDEALTRTISELRRIFQDDARSPRVIETIRKSGYRLVAPVTPVPESDPLPPPPAPSPDRSEPAPSTSFPGGAGPFSIADWLVEPELGRLTRNGDVARLEPRAMQVLTRLAARPGQVVSRTSLLESVWPPGAVHETALNGAISDLRRVFGDAPESPRYVETIRGVGYRLVAPVHGAAGSDARPAAGGSARRRLLVGGASLAGAVAIAGALALVLVSREAGPVPFAREWQVRPLTAYPGTEVTPALSPDGSLIAFSWRGEDAREGDLFDLYLMQAESGTPVRLTSEPGHEIYPAWSPDGSTIAYASGVSDSFEIRTVPVLGGAPRRLLAVGGPVAGLDWSPDGASLAYSAPADSGPTLRIHVLELDTMGSRLLDVPRVPGDDVSPAFSPDGTTLAFIREENFNRQRVFCTVLGSGEARELGDLGDRVAGLDWISGHELVISASNLIDYDLWLADLDTGRSTWLTVPGRPAVAPTVSRNGSRVVYGELTYECNIWSVDLQAGGRIRPGGEPLIASTRTDYSPVCSPDGERIAFLSDRSGRIELWIADADGRNPWQLTEEMGSYLMNPRWSPDGARIAYSATSNDRLCVFASDVGTRVAKRLSAPGSHELLVHWSSSGEWLYSRVLRDDVWELWRRRPDGSDAERLMGEGYTVHGEVEGGDLICSKDDDTGVWRLPAAGGEARRVVSADLARNWLGVAVAENGLFFIRRGVSTAWLGFHDWASAREDSLGPVPVESGMLVLSPDRARLLYDCTTRFEIDLMLAEIAP